MSFPFYFRTLVLFIVLAVGAACASPPTGPSMYELRGSAMGTSFVVKIVNNENKSESQVALQELVQTELALVDGLMSHYRPDSELSRFNRHAQTTPFVVSDETFAVLAEASRISDWTKGAFDITVGPLVEAWGFGVAPGDEPPSDALIEELRERLGFAKLRLDPEARTVQKNATRLEGDLSAIAKGYAVDRVAEALESAGFSRYMVEVGGEVRTAGYNQAGAPWQIAIERPDTGVRLLQTTVPLTNASMATSGDYRNFYEWKGERFSHTIDPRTGRPVNHALASVTVVSRMCMTADALATALLVLGPEDGYRFAVANDVASLMVVRQPDGSGFEYRSTPAFERVLSGGGVE